MKRVLSSFPDITELEKEITSKGKKTIHFSKKFALAVKH